MSKTKPSSAHEVISSSNIFYSNKITDMISQREKLEKVKKEIMKINKREYARENKEKLNRYYKSYTKSLGELRENHKKEFCDILELLTSESDKEYPSLYQESLLILKQCYPEEWKEIREKNKLNREKNETSNIN